MVSGPFGDDSLPRLKRQFIQEIKRNLFEVYLRPRQMVINLISMTTSSAAAFPGGEAFDFTFSPNGHWVLALCSSRIYVVDTVSPVVTVQRELKVLRRPVSAAILDDGSLLAVLSSVHQVNIYDLSNLKLKYLRAVSLDNPPNTIALSPKGEVLAAAYDGGIEVHSLADSALSTDRRSVKCDSVDSLTFSGDGTILFGTTLNSKNPNTVVLSAPYHSEANQEMPVSDLLSHMWTSQILFPNSSRDCSHAALLPHFSEGDARWTFTYDRVFESFRAVRTDDLRNGTTYFTGPKTPSRAGPRSARKKLMPCTLPATSDRGELVAAGFLGKEVWLYGVPENLDTTSATGTDDPSLSSVTTSRSSAVSDTGRNVRSPARSLTRGEAAELRRLPQWQVLVDKYRNVFAKGRRIAEIQGVAGVHWVKQRHRGANSRSIAQRLIIAAPGGVSAPSDVDQDDFAIVDGGRLIIIDFDRTKENGKHEEITLEVGNVTPETLEEEGMDMDTEIALVRQRTVRQRRDGTIGTTVADVLGNAPDLPPQHPPVPALPTSLAPVEHAAATIAEDCGTRPSSSSTDGLSLEEASAVFDGPYSHTHPRSRTSLYRSATAVAANRQRNPLRVVSDARVEYRRADGRGELPHESDADNWVPPPPPYTRDPDRPLPESLRTALMPGRNDPNWRATDGSDGLRRAGTVASSSTQNSPTRRMSSLPERPSMLRSQSTSSSLSSSLNASQFRQIEETWSGISQQTGHSISQLSSGRLSQSVSPGETMSLGPGTPPTRRPVSAYAGHYMGFSQRPSTGRLTSPISPIPEPLSTRRRNHVKSVSLPSSPVSTEAHASNLTLTGANLQHRLEYPLPPAPNPVATESSPSLPYQQASPTTTIQAIQEIESIAACMPSAQQLANLQSRYSQPSTTQHHRQLTPDKSTSTGYVAPAPPRGALGAAGSPTSPAAERRRLSVAQKNSFAASSPALLRPPIRRLETIQSLASSGSESRMRSRSRDADAAIIVRNRRSRSLGPDTLLEQREAKRKWFTRRKPKKAKEEKASVGREGGSTEDVRVDDSGGENGRASRCQVM